MDYSQEDEPILNSILDTDLYKLTMQQAVLEIYPEVEVEYRFKNRGEHKFDTTFLDLLRNEINKMSTLSITDEEYEYLNSIPYFKPQYVEFLRNYRFNPDEVDLGFTEDNDLSINISGKWINTILWEVPLMAVISELYFKYVDVVWAKSDQNDKAIAKISKLSESGCKFAEFGTRRRRGLQIHEDIVKSFCEYTSENPDKSTFVGTSNVKMAMEHNLRPVGTCAHEFIQAMQALESINHCNYYAMHNWVRVYNCDLGIALSDTVRTDMFLQNFNKRFAMMFKGVRHDSGDPFDFTDKVVNHYEDLDIDPMSKAIIFSDGLNVDKAIEINEYCSDKIQCSFGIGTNLTNDFKNSKPLNMVIKLWSVGGFPVVKLSDIEGKENGDSKAVEHMKWVVDNQLSSGVEF